MLINKKIYIVNFLIFIFLFVNINGQTSTTVWEKDLHNSGYESFNSVIQTSDSGFVCVGELNPFGGDSYSDLWIVKLNPSGDTIWSKTIESLGITEFITDVIEMKLSNRVLMIIGESQNNLMFTRIDSFGNIKWKKIYGEEYLSSSITLKNFIRK